MNRQSKVSIITIFFNAEKFIEESVESVFAQNYKNWELWLVDDGSTDASTEIAKRYSNNYSDKVKYLAHDGHKNLGMSASRNLGVRTSKGQFVAFLDADDVWLPHKLERQVDILDAQRSASMVCGAPQYWHSWTGMHEDLNRDYISDLGVRPDTIFMPPTLLHLLIEDTGAPCPSDLLVRREVFDRVGGFEESFTGNYQLYEDQPFLSKMYLNEPVYVSTECWLRYRIHPDSCVSVVTRAGDYDKIRLFFLNWLETYLSEQKERYPDVAVRLQNVLASLRAPSRTSVKGKNFQAVDIRQGNWWFRVGAGNLAHLEFISDDSNMVRLCIEKAATDLTSDIQLNRPRLRVKANHSYIVSFFGRSDRPRQIWLGCAECYSPWSNLGLYSTVELTPEWRSFEEPFVATADALNARIHFDVGDSDVSLELASVSLRSLLDERWIKPDVPPV